MCILKIYSETESFEEFSKNTKIPLVIIQIKGQQKRASKNQVYENHRLSIEVSDKEWDDFNGQVVDAIEFLANHAQELESLLKSHKVTSAYLDFPLYSRLDDEIINQNDHLPRELIILAGRIGLGIEMAIYDRKAFSEIGT